MRRVQPWPNSEVLTGQLWAQRLIKSTCSIMRM